MKLRTRTATIAFALSITGTPAYAQSVSAEESTGAVTVNLICGKDDPQDDYYSEVALNEHDGIATFARRSNGRTIGPDRMPAIFTPTDVQFEKLISPRTGTKEVFVISRVDLTLTRWFEASFAQEKPRKSVIQCSIATAPSNRIF